VTSSSPGATTATPASENGSSGPSTTATCPRPIRGRLRRRATAAVFLTTAAFTALVPQAMAAPMPWKTSRTTSHHAPSTAVGDRGTVTVLRVGGCYQ
jgi:hypothetical protein